MIRPFGVILAGGQARRMGGGDKGRLMLGDRTILDHVIGRIAPQVSDLALNANGDPNRFADTGLPVISDSIEGFAGPLAGVLAGMDWAAERGADYIVTAAADTPFLPLDLVDGLVASAREAGTSISLAATPDPERGINRHPTFGLWPVALRNDLRMALSKGLRKVVLWTDKHGAAQTMFQTVPVDPFFNVNEPQDLEQARILIENSFGNL